MLRRSPLALALVAAVAVVAGCATGPRPHFQDNAAVGGAPGSSTGDAGVDNVLSLLEGNDTVGAGTTHQQRLLSNWFRLRGQFVEGTLQVIGLGGGTSSYRRQPDGTLAVTQTWLGAVSRSTMTRAPE